MNANVPIPCCPICYEVIREPVVFPCRHEICRECFSKSLETANLWCPLCRKRISSWARRNISNPVDVMRRKEIQERLSDMEKENLPIDHQSLDTCQSFYKRLKLSEPGEIKREYISELETVTKEREEEDRLGEAEAWRIFHEEEQTIQAEMEREEQLGYLVAKAFHDEEIARERSQKEQFEEDAKMAELLSQEFIQHRYESQQKQMLQDREFAKRLENMCDRNVPNGGLTNACCMSHSTHVATRQPKSSLKKTPSGKRTKYCSSKTQSCCVESSTKPITFWLKPQQRDKL